MDLLTRTKESSGSNDACIVACYKQYVLLSTDTFVYVTQDEPDTDTGSG